MCVAFICLFKSCSIAIPTSIPGEGGEMLLKRQLLVKIEILLVKSGTICDLQTQHEGHVSETLCYTANVTDSLP